MNYILKGHTAELCPDILTWAKWFETADRHVGNDTVNGVRVSTVFLGLDHQFGNGPPLLFETMVFGGSNDEDQVRYSTWEEAEEGHRQILEREKNLTRQSS